MLEIRTFGVIGAGQMGNGIAQVAAMSGLNVIMSDIKQEFVDRGLATVTKILTRNEARYEPSHGPVDSRGPDWSGHLPGHYGNPLRRLQGLKVPPLPAAAQIRRSRLAGKKNGEGVLRL